MASYTDHMLDNCTRALTWTILDEADLCLDSPGHALLAVKLHALRPPAPVKAYRAYRANVPQCNFGTNAAWLCKPTLTLTTRVLGIGDKFLGNDPLLQTLRHHFIVDSEHLACASPRACYHKLCLNLLCTPQSIYCIHTRCGDAPLLPFNRCCVCQLQHGIHQYKS